MKREETSAGPLPGLYHVPLAMTQRQPHKCPCCDGYGRREVAQAMGTTIRYEQCHACKGTGIVWEPKP